MLEPSQNNSAIAKQTTKILQQLNNYEKQIQFSFGQSFVKGEINKLDIDAPQMQQEMLISLPKLIRNQKVWKLQVKAIEYYKQAYKKFEQIMLKKIANKKSYSEQFDKYDQSQLKIMKVYLTKNMILFSEQEDEEEEKRKKISDYKHFIIQNRYDYDELKKKIQNYIAIINKLKKNQEKKQNFFSKLFKNKSHVEQQAQQSIQKVIKKSYFLMQKWAFSNNQMTYRIICIHENPNKNFANFYIYYNSFLQQKNKVLIDSQQNAINLKDQLVIAHYAEKHRKQIKLLSNRYKQNLTRELSNRIIGNSLIDFIDKNNDNAQKQVRIDSLEYKIKEYENDCLKQLIQKWNDKSKQYSKYNKTSLLLEAYSFTFPKNIKAQKIDLYINNEFYANLQYDGEDKYSWRFINHNPKKIIHNLQEMKHQVIDFRVQVQEQGHKLKKIYVNNVKITKFQNEALGFSYQLGLLPKDKSPLPQGFKYDYPYVLIFDAMVQKINTKLLNNAIPVRKLRLINLLANIGKIPNLYSSYYSLKYTPKQMSIISQILSGKNLPINKSNFQKTYVDFIHFFQHEENRSQNFCLYLKMNDYTSKNSGYLAKDRYDKYTNILKNKISYGCKKYQQISKGSIDKLFRPTFEVVIDKITRKKDLANLKNDIDKIDLYNKEKISAIIRRYIIYCDYENKSQSKASHHLGYNKSMIKIANLIIQIYQRRIGGGDGLYESMNLSYTDLLLFFTAFIHQIYPFHKDLKYLLTDLYHIRVLIQKYLPHFNYRLNRCGKGLQNIAGQYLINLFTNLPMQLCFRIWDFMIINKSKLKNARIIAVFTLLIFQQKSEMTPIFPINQIIQAMQINLVKIKLDDSSVYHYTKTMDNYYAPRKDRKNKIHQYASQKYLKRFCYGRAIKQVDMLDEQQVEKPSIVSEKPQSIMFTHDKLQRKLLSLNQLSYPLPRPNYKGAQIQKIYVLLGGVFLLKNLNFHRKKYSLNIKINSQAYSKQFPITDKNIYLNQYFEMNFDNDITNTIIIQFLEENKQKNRGIITLSNFHKDQIYKQNVVLHDIDENYKNNLGNSVVEVTFIQKSKITKIFDNPTNNCQKYLQICQKLLDYDLQKSNNSTIKAMKSMNKTLNKILYPLDQLNVQQYPNLKFPIYEDFDQVQWLKNSRVSIQELKAILNTIFTDQNQKNKRLKLSNIYDQYSQNFQYFSLGKFLLQLILITPINTQKKINMLYCICVHYQNLNHPSKQQKITIQTLNSIIRQIYEAQGVLNACPYSPQSIGTIISAYFYEKGQKVEEQKKQITNLIQDWAAILRSTTNCSGIFLGTSTHLTILKSMFPADILQKLQQKQFCRFQITYENDQGTFLWSATVRSSNFQVIRRGVRFLNAYPKYNQDIKYFDSIGESLLNCQNFIPIQSVKALSYDQFCQFFKNNTLLYYVLSSQRQRLSTQNNQNQIYTLSLPVSLSRMSNISEYNQQNRNKQSIKYTDYAIYRHQNCLIEWKKCKKLKQAPQSLTAIVQYEDYQGEYQIPTFELISMDENLIEEDNMQASSFFSQS